MTRLDYDRTWQDLSLVSPPRPAWEEIPEYPKQPWPVDKSMPRDRKSGLRPPQERKPKEPPHWAFYHAFNGLSDEHMLNRWPAVLEELNGVYVDVLHYDEKWGTPRGQLEKTFAEIRVLIERRAKLAARRCAPTRVEHEQPDLGEKVDSRGAHLHVPGDHAR